ncbi:MAG TPA: response regulator transcription factor [Candidatus Limivivens merdigallinarum]|uniref:Stage 0 sporulation protein A homolog n=1 Tax=Candidatus Limivivens merdigallinarum TaxID=2840859 RepID=A0A9D0ZXA5_9FIRM|nr:response regulator transcription factor [Candidatus Limivivens merdigallinarum]
MSKLLLLEDDESLIDGLGYSLGRAGFRMEIARNLQECRRALEEEGEYDLLLLDVTLPDGSGFQICEEMRAKGSSIPIIFLTAADEETSIIRGLDLGGDDYITKPFRLGELLSRIRALLRRAARGREEGAVLKSGSLTIDTQSLKVYRDGEALELTGAEYRLLCLLVKNAGRILTRSMILDALWDGNGNYVDDNTLSVYIRRLREKIEKDPSSPQSLLTVRGLGYQWKEQEE